MILTFFIKRVSEVKEAEEAVKGSLVQKEIQDSLALLVLLDLLVKMGQKVSEVQLGNQDMVDSLVRMVFVDNQESEVLLGKMDLLGQRDNQE